MRNASPSAASTGRGAESPRTEARRGGAEKVPPSREDVQKFRAQLAAADGRRERPEIAGQHEWDSGEAESMRPMLADRKDSPDRQTSMHEAPADGESVTVAALLLQQAQQAPSAVQTTAVASGAPHAAAFAELIERHVKQMLVSDGGMRRGRDGKLMLRMADRVFPDTMLTLSRTDSGWRLESESDSIDTRREISELAPGLVERFSERGLGELVVEAGVTTPTN